MELLRLAGPPGVGKSTTAWTVARRFADDGMSTGYVDTDQLGMCYPAPDDDPDRWALKERALAGVAEEFRRAGVERLVVSGVAWPDDPPPRIAGVSVRSLWLDASEHSRRERLGARGTDGEQLSEMLSAGTAEAERVHSAWERVDTDGLSPSETVGEVLMRWRPTAVENRRPGSERSMRLGAAGGDRLLWLTGLRLAGASRIGWEIATREWREGTRTGFIDLAQLSFAWNIDEAVGPASLARVHRCFREVGADLLVVVAPIEIEPEAARAVLPNSDVSSVRLSPSAADLRRHAHFRRSGEGPALAGDDVIGATDAEVEVILRTADLQSSLPLREHEVSVRTRGLSPADAAAAVRRGAGWSAVLDRP